MTTKMYVSKSPVFNAVQLNDDHIEDPKGLLPDWVTESDNVEITKYANRDGYHIAVLKPSIITHSANSVRTGDWIIQHPSRGALMEFKYGFSGKYAVLEVVDADRGIHKIRYMPKTTPAIQITDEFFTDDLPLPDGLRDKESVYRNKDTLTGVVVGYYTYDSMFDSNETHIEFRAGDWLFNDRNGNMVVSAETDTALLKDFEEK